MRRALATAFVTLGLILAGCLAVPDDDDPQPPASTLPSPQAGQVVIACRLVDPAGAPIEPGTCRFRFGAQGETLAVAADGRAGLAVNKGVLGDVTGDAPERDPRMTDVVSDASKTVILTLPPTAGPYPSGSPGPGGSPTISASPSPTGGPGPAPPPRRWLAPVRVPVGGNEPMVAVASDGTIYYSPLNVVMRSDDGGATWSDVSPGFPDAFPVLASDTSISLAPDDSLWFARTWGYAGSTLACTSTDRGGSWTCDNAAIPGATDRMWVVGLSDTVGYAQTNEGLYQRVYAKTETGSLKYVPYATTTDVAGVRNGNIVYDPATGDVRQVEHRGGTQRIIRVEDALALANSADTGVPATYALPWLSVRDGVYWMTGEPAGTDGSARLVMARSTDAGASWTEFAIPTTAASVTFSFAAAGPNGRAAAVFYGSDAPGPSAANGGVWSLYVVETHNALSPNPTWVETRLVDVVHEGNVCIGLNCEQSGNDPYARFSGDLIGAWIDDAGNVHVAYNEDAGDHVTRNMYVRQAA